MRYFLVVRDPQTKATLVIHEFLAFRQAMRRRRWLRQQHEGEVVLCYARSREELLATFSEYRPNTHADFTGSRSGASVVVPTSASARLTRTQPCNARS